MFTDEPLFLPHDSVGQARRLALRAHRGQLYGLRPYRTHLEAVVQTLERHACTTPVLLATAWLHDALEDTDLTADEIEQRCGVAVRTLVEAVTSRVGNRRTRTDRLLAQLKAQPMAIPVKLADRIANVEACRRTADPRVEMYRKEHPLFTEALGQCLPDAYGLWSTLDLGLRL